MKKVLTVISVISPVTALISALLGLFYSFGGTQRTVTNIYGQQVTLLGDGVYANDSVMKAAAAKGTDITIIIAALFLLCILIFHKNKSKAILVRCGLLSILLYASACLVFGVVYNMLFLLYLLQFGSTLFSLILSLKQLLSSRAFDEALYKIKLTGTAVFLIIAGCSTLIWIPFVLTPTITGQPMQIIEIYTTEPTFILDLAIILPLLLYCAIALLQQKESAYHLAPVFLTLLTGVGVCVIFQTIIQISLGIVLDPGQFVGMVVSFIILGTVALVLNIRLLRRTV